MRQMKEYLKKLAYRILNHEATSTPHINLIAVIWHPFAIERKENGLL